MPGNEAVHCRELVVRYGPVTALAGISVEVAAGEIVALLGVSGSGKSTLLHAVAGLVRPSGGEIWLHGKQASDDLPPERRDIGMVFQHAALWPHLSVLDTVAYPLRRAGRSRRDAYAEAMRQLGRLDIARLADRRPAALSGGEQQRVGLARALARAATLYLLDEPTAHLDTSLRQAFQELVVGEQRRTDAAVVLATHDPAEALARADRIALLDAGRVIQFGTPPQLYDEPASLVAAALTGPYAVIEAAVRPVGDGTLAVELPDGTSEIVASAASADGIRQLLVRPDWVSEAGPLAGRIASVAFRGPRTDYRIDSAAGGVLMSLPGAPRYRTGDRVRWGLSRVWPLPAAGRQVGTQPSAVIAAG